MPKFALDVEYDYEFQLFGISCHEKDYRVCWALNNSFGFELHKIDDLEIKDKKQKQPHGFSVFGFFHEDSYTEYFLISNRHGKTMLIPEHKSADYFFMVKGSILMTDEEVLAKLKSINFILTAFNINVHDLKSKKNLVF